MASIDNDFKTLTKADIIAQVINDVTGNKRDATELVEAFFEIIATELEMGNDVKLTGFGNFQTRDKVARPGRNPKTGEEKVISARRVVTFHAGPKLREMVQERTSKKS